MNNVLIIDASASDSRVMHNLLTKAGYDPTIGRRGIDDKDFVHVK